MMMREAPDDPRVGILGLGLMGLGIAQAAAAEGLRVTLVGRDAASADKGLSRLTMQLRRQVERGRMSADAATTLLGNVEAAHDDSALGECDVVIESVDEDREVKIHALRRIEAAASEGALIATNTSGLPIGGLARAFVRPERFLGLHFFSPVERMRLVEVVHGVATSAEAVRIALAFVARLGKRPIVVRDRPGFFTSRVFAAYLDEALAMLGEGTPASLIEEAAIANGRALGPLAVLDEVGLRLNVQQGLQARADDLEERFCRPLALPVLSRMLERGRGGRRDGGGFYDYPDAGAKSLWSGLAEAFPPALAPDRAALALRLACVEAREALRCLEEGVIASADDADAASLLGLGYPAKTGGVLAWVESFGLPAFVEACDQLARNHGSRFAPSPFLRDLADRGEIPRLYKPTAP